jgi:hypothetical protein
MIFKVPISGQFDTDDILRAENSHWDTRRLFLCIPPFGVARIINCDTQGKVTRENKGKERWNTHIC